MTTTTDNLAAALRAALDARTLTHGSATLQYDRIEREGRQALRAYDAEQQRAPDLATAAAAILADVDAPGHTVRSITGQSVAQLRAALGRPPTSTQPLGSAPRGSL